MGSAYDPLVLKDCYVDAGHYDIGQGPHARTLINQSWIQLSIYQTSVWNHIKKIDRRASSYIG